MRNVLPYEQLTVELDGLIIYGQVTNNIRYGDETVVVASTIEDLLTSMKSVNDVKN